MGISRLSLLGYFQLSPTIDLLRPMIEGTKENFGEIGDTDVFEEAKLVADSGYHTEANMKMIMEQGIDAYIPDTHFRKRDPRFANIDRYKEKSRNEQRELNGTKLLYHPREFTVTDDKKYCICPEGKRLYFKANVIINGYHAMKFHGRKTECRICEARAKCLKYPDRTEAGRYVSLMGVLKSKYVHFRRG